jgi:hypothetical protein
MSTVAGVPTFPTLLTRNILLTLQPFRWRSTPPQYPVLDFPQQVGHPGCSLHDSRFENLLSIFNLLSILRRSCRLISGSSIPFLRSGFCIPNTHDGSFQHFVLHVHPFWVPGATLSLVRSFLTTLTLRRATFDRRVDRGLQSSWVRIFLEMYLFRHATVAIHYYPLKKCINLLYINFSSMLENTHKIAICL